VSSARSLRIDIVDTTVLEVYGLVHDQAWLADRALEVVLRRESRLYANERRAVAEAVYGMVRSRRRIDWALAGRARPADHGARYAAWLAEQGGMDPKAAARRLGVNPTILEPIPGMGAALAQIADPVERLAIGESLPTWIADRFIAELGLDEARALARAMNQRAPLTVRANTIRGTRDELRERLKREGVAATPTTYSPWGLVLDGHSNAFALPSFREGLFEIQDEGSQLIALAVGARPGNKVVDACAGAGGKTLALAMEMRNRGEVAALDVDEGRLEEARRRARRDGVHNVRTKVVPADPAEADAAVAPLGGADRVLVDAPCSGLGTLRRKPDARWRLKPADPERFAALQLSLALRYAALVKPGGRFVYATCAIGRTENDEVAERVVREVPGLVPLPATEALGPELAGALGADGHVVKLYPHRHGTDGFFVACFKRS
jgi:16S rRNA (cytosine967-C5)-methyltransferase